VLLPVSEIKLPLSGSVPSRAVVDLRRYHFDSDPLVVDTGTAAVGVGVGLTGAGVGTGDLTGGEVAGGCVRFCWAAGAGTGTVLRAGVEMVGVVV
jgi:hypothetical protein